MANQMTCSHWPTPGAANRCQADATHHVMTPDGEPCPGSYVCEDHGRRVVAEYRDKLGAWSLARCDEFGAPLQEAHQVLQPHDDTWAVFWRGRRVLDGATYTIASHVVHELAGGRCGVGECQEVADAIKARSTPRRPYYINRRGNGYHETVGEFEDQDEARKMLTEYQISDPDGSYRVSRTPRPGWHDEAATP